MNEKQKMRHTFHSTGRMRRSSTLNKNSKINLLRERPNLTGQNFYKGEKILQAQTFFENTPANSDQLFMQTNTNLSNINTQQKQYVRLNSANYRNLIMR